MPISNQCHYFMIFTQTAILIYTKVHQLDLYQQGVHDYSHTVIKRLSNALYQTFNVPSNAHLQLVFFYIRNSKVCCVYTRGAPRKFPQPIGGVLPLKQSSNCCEKPIGSHKMAIKCPLAINAFYIRNCKVCLVYTHGAPCKFPQPIGGATAKTVIKLL